MSSLDNPRQMLHTAVRRRGELSQKTGIPPEQLETVVADHADLFSERELAALRGFFAIGQAKAATLAELAATFGVSTVQAGNIRDRAADILMGAIRDKIKDVPEDILDYTIEQFFTTARVGSDAVGQRTLIQILKVFKELLGTQTGEGQPVSPTMREVVSVSRKQLLRMDGMGNERVDVIEALLRAAGLSLAPDTE